MPGNRAPYRNALRRGLANALTRAWIPLSPEDLERRCSWLLKLKTGERSLWVRNSRRAAHPDVLRELVSKSYELRLTHPFEALEIAQAAVETAEALDLGSGWTEFLRDLQAQAWGNLANAYRLVGDPKAAERAWQPAEARFAAGSGDPILAGDLASKKGVFLRSLGKFEEAVSLLSNAITFREQVVEMHAAGRARVDLAITHFYAGDAKAALAQVPLAAQQLDTLAEPEMGLALIHNTLFFLEADHQEQLALALVDRADPWYRELDSPLLGHRAGWLRGRLHLALGHYRTATAYLEVARRGFVAAGQPYDAALTGFDLGLAWTHLGGHYRVAHMAQEMYSVLVAQEIPREAAATLLLFADAAKQQRLNLALMRQLAQKLEPLRRPGARPEPTPAENGELS